VKVRIGDVMVDTDRLETLSAGGKLEARLLLQEVERLKAVNPMHFYRPANEKHASFQRSRAGVKAIFGGNRSGKTTTAICDDIIQMCPPELLPAHLQEFKFGSCPFYCRVMTPDMERTMKPVIHHKLREWLPTALIPLGFDKHYNKQSQSLQLECGCRFDFLSFEMDIDKFGGAALHRCHYDEEPPSDIREECLMRLVDFDGDEVFSMTPLKGLTWSHKEILKNDDPDIFKVTVSMRDNPHLNPKGVDRKLKLLSADARRMREQGEFHNAAGYVYPEVREWTCQRAPNETYAAYDTLIAIDPGIRKAGITWTSWTGESFVTYDARTLRDQTVEGYVQEIRRTNARYGLKDAKVHYIIDPAGTARSLVNAESVETELNRLGIYCEHGQNDVDTGVLMLRRLGIAGSWMIVDDLTDFLDTLDEYPLVEHADGTLHPAKTGNEHAADAVRYAISTRAWPDEELAASPVSIGAKHVSTDHDVATGPPGRRGVERVGNAGAMV
jgi:phage terminase large subunit-like protein